MTTLYTLNLYRAVCHLHLNKTGGKKTRILLKPSPRISNLVGASWGLGSGASNKFSGNANAAWLQLENH